MSVAWANGEIAGHAVNEDAPNMVCEDATECTSHVGIDKIERITELSHISVTVYYTTDENETVNVTT